MLHPPLILREVDDDEWFVLESMDALTFDAHDVLWGLAYEGYDSQGYAFHTVPRAHTRSWLWGLVTTTSSVWSVDQIAATPDLAGATSVAQQLVQNTLAAWGSRIPHPPSHEWRMHASLPALLQWMLAFDPMTG